MLEGESGLSKGLGAEPELGVLHAQVQHAGGSQLEHAAEDGPVASTVDEQIESKNGLKELKMGKENLAHQLLQLVLVVVLHEDRLLRQVPRQKGRRQPAEIQQLFGETRQQSRLLLVGHLALDALHLAAPVGCIALQMS